MEEDFFLKNMKGVKPFKKDSPIIKTKTTIKKNVKLKTNEVYKRSLEKEKRKYQRENFLRNWREWLSLENTQQAILPLIITIFISSFIGWSLGISKNSCNPYFEQNLDQLN